MLEEVIILTLQDLKLQPCRLSDINTGVWIGYNKVSAIGITASRWITMHGCSINIYNSLDAYKHIIPCGISDSKYSVTTVLHELYRTRPKANLTDIIKHLFATQLLPSKLNEKESEFLPLAINNDNDNNQMKLRYLIEQLYIHHFNHIFDVEVEVEDASFLDRLLPLYPDIAHRTLEPLVI